MLSSDCDADRDEGERMDLERSRTMSREREHDEQPWRAQAKARAKASKNKQAYEAPLEVKHERARRCTQIGVVPARAPRQDAEHQRSRHPDILAAHPTRHSHSATHATNAMHKRTNTNAEERILSFASQYEATR